MAFRIELQPGAEDDIDAAYNWYENRRAGLGEQFLDELEKYYSRLENNPFVFSYTEYDYRQAAMHHFPYVIIYKIVKDEVLIYAVFHMSRNPTEKFLKR